MVNHILPTPKKSECFDKTFELVPAIYTDHDGFKEKLSVFVEAFKAVYCTSIAIAKGGIEVVFDPSLAKDAYVINSTDGLRVMASDTEGLLYAFATILQMPTVKNGVITVEEAIIEDCPDKDFRTIMIDLSRQWHPASKIFIYIDICFILKIKYLHLHFIDDQRYTLPSKAFDKISSPQHYTYDQIASFVSYAKSRGIIIIPEFEAPGHASALTRSYPEIFANDLGEGKDATIVTEEGLTINSKNIVCAGKQECIDGINTIIEEIVEMFPDSPYIHIGGDEAVINVWPLCNKCREYMEKNGIEDQYELYSDFIGRVAQLVIDKGRTPIVWEGFPKKGNERVPRETVVIAWESHYHMVEDLLEEGFKVINSSWQPLYIVPGHKLRWGPKEIMNWSVYNWQHWWPHSEATLNPKNVQPTDQVIGAQICDWECTYEQSVSFLVENTIALSERLWNVRRLWDDKDYYVRHKKLLMITHNLIQDR